MLSLKGERFLEVSFVDDIGMDSLDALEFVMCVEKEFGVYISDEDVAEIVKIGDLKKTIEKNLTDGKMGIANDTSVQETRAVKQVNYGIGFARRIAV